MASSSSSAESKPPDVFYNIKTIQFLDRSCPIILQNHNGPCSLIAICNVLLLKNKLNMGVDTTQVSESELLNLVRESLIASSGDIHDKDAENLRNAIELLPRLTSDISVDVKFKRKDEFEFPECVIFDLLGIPLYHGWIVDPKDYDTANAIGSMSYNAITLKLVALDAQSTGHGSKSNPEESSVDFAATTAATLGVPSPCLSKNRSFNDSLRSVADQQRGRKSKGDLKEEEDLAKVWKLSLAESQTSVGELPVAKGEVVLAEQVDKTVRSKDGITPQQGKLIKKFLEDFSTQLTVYGLSCLQTELEDGKLCVFFRNNHFNTMFKYNGGLYLLVTDQGYIDQPDLVWEKLHEVNRNPLFMTDEFKEFKGCLASIDNSEEESDPDQQLYALLSKKIASTTNDGELAKYFYQRALLLFRLKRFEDVLNDAERALRALRGTVDDWKLGRKCKRLQAEASLELGNYTDAETLFKVILAISRKCDPTIRVFDAEEELLIGKTYMLMGDFRQAREHFNEAINLARIDGSDKIAQAGFSFLQDNTAREKKANELRRNRSGNRNKPKESVPIDSPKIGVKKGNTSRKNKEHTNKSKQVVPIDSTNIEGNEEEQDAVKEAPMKFKLDSTPHSSLEDCTDGEKKGNEEEQDAIPLLKDCTDSEKGNEEASYVEKIVPKEFERRISNFEYWISKKQLQFDVYEAYMMKIVFQNDQFVSQKIACRVLELSDEYTARYQQHASSILGEAAIKVILVDGCSVVLEEITTDFNCWYSLVHSSFESQSNNNWWNYIESDFKKLFRGIFKSFSRFYPAYSHGNWTNGLAVVNGEGKLYNMRYLGNGGCHKDIKSLLQLIINALKRLRLAKFDLDDNWSVQGQDSEFFYKSLCSVKFANFMARLHKFVAKKESAFFFYDPYFWDPKERMHFLEELYDMFWTDKDLLVAKDVLVREFDKCFKKSWLWWKFVPPSGSFRNILDRWNDSDQATMEMQNKGGVRVQISHKRINSILYWRQCRHHYNSNLDESEYPKSVEAVEAELDERLNVCLHAFNAVSEFIITRKNHEFRALRQRMIGLLLSCGCPCVVI